MTNLPLRCAEALAAFGVPVFPCQPGKKTPATPQRLPRCQQPTPYQSANGSNATPTATLANPHGCARTRRPGHRPARRGRQWVPQPLARLDDAGLLAGASGKTLTPSGGAAHLLRWLEPANHPPGRLPPSTSWPKAATSSSRPSQVNGEPYRVLAYLPGRGGLDWDAAARLLQPGPRARTETAQASTVGTGRQAGPLGRRPARRQPQHGLFWAANRALEADQAADLSPLAMACPRAGLTNTEITQTLRSRPAHHPGHPEPRGREAEGGS